MSVTVKLRKVGDSLGVILPKELLQELKLSEGDRLHVTLQADGACLSTDDSEFASAMKAFGRTLEALAN
jgi:putative addiction module antidote